MGSRGCESQRRKELDKKKIYLVFARTIKGKTSKTEDKKSMKKFFFSKDFCGLCSEGWGGEKEGRKKKRRRRRCRSKERWLWPWHCSFGGEGEGALRLSIEWVV